MMDWSYLQDQTCFSYTLSICCCIIIIVDIDCSSNVSDGHLHGQQSDCSRGTLAELRLGCFDKIRNRFKSLGKCLVFLGHACKPNPLILQDGTGQSKGAVTLAGPQKRANASTKIVWF